MKKKANVWRDIKIGEETWVEVYKNPSASDIPFANHALGARACLVNYSDLYVWKYDDAQHKDIVSELDGTRKVPMVIQLYPDSLLVQKASWSSSVCISKDEVLKAAGVKKLAGNREIDFFDSDCKKSEIIEQILKEAYWIKK